MMNKHFSTILIAFAIFTIGGCGKDSRQTDETALPRLEITAFADNSEMKPYVAGCLDAEFEEVLRRPMQYIGKDVHFRGEAKQVDMPDFVKGNHRGKIWIQQGGRGEEWEVLYDDENTSFPDGYTLVGDDVTVCGRVERIDHGVDSKGIGWNAPVVIARIVTSKLFENLTCEKDDDVDCDEEDKESDGEEDD